MVLTAGAPFLRARTSEVLVVHLRLSLRILHLSRHLNAAVCSVALVAEPVPREASVLLSSTFFFDHVAPPRLANTSVFACRNMLADAPSDASSLRRVAGWSRVQTGHRTKHNLWEVSRGARAVSSGKPPS